MSLRERKLTELGQFIFYSILTVLALSLTFLNQFLNTWSPKIGLKGGINKFNGIIGFWFGILTGKILKIFCVSLWKAKICILFAHTPFYLKTDFFIIFHPWPDVGLMKLILQSLVAKSLREIGLIANYKIANDTFGRDRLALTEKITSDSWESLVIYSTASNISESLVVQKSLVKDESIRMLSKNKNNL